MIKIELTIKEAEILKAMMQNPMSDDEPGDQAAVRRQVFTSLPTFEWLAEAHSVMRKARQSGKNYTPDENQL